MTLLIPLFSRMPASLSLLPLLPTSPTVIVVSFESVSALARSLTSLDTPVQKIVYSWGGEKKTSLGNEDVFKLSLTT